MNILAHLYLSGNFNQVMLGNFMGDFVKGKQYQSYPLQIQKGILLHRKIDDFTDKHSMHKQSRDRFRAYYGLHSGVVVDIVYDHFLASHWDKFHFLPVEIFAQKTYGFIDQNFDMLPHRLKEIVPFIIKNNWLVMYKSSKGLERVLMGMSNRTSLPDHAPFAMKVLQNDYNNLYDEFQSVMDSLLETIGLPWEIEKIDHLE